MTALGTRDQIESQLLIHYSFRFFLLGGWGVKVLPCQLSTN